MRPTEKTTAELLEIWRKADMKPMDSGDHSAFAGAAEGSRICYYDDEMTIIEGRSVDDGPDGPYSICFETLDQGTVVLTMERTDI